jgi:hypothetical protein
LFALYKGADRNLFRHAIKQDKASNKTRHGKTRPATRGATAHIMARQGKKTRNTRQKQENRRKKNKKKLHIKVCRFGSKTLLKPQNGFFLGIWRMYFN